MKKMIVLAGGLLLTGCANTWPITARTAPEPTPQEITQIRATQIRMIAAPIDGAVARGIQVLMDNGYVIRAVDQASGFIAFHQQWTDPSQGGVDLSVDGSVVFAAAGSNTTQVRVALTGSWQAVQTSFVGHGTTDALVGGMQQTTDGNEYKKLLDLFERALTSH